MKLSAGGQNLMNESSLSFGDAPGENLTVSAIIILNSIEKSNDPAVSLLDLGDAVEGFHGLLILV